MTTVAAIALVPALAAGRVALVAVAAPLLWVLATGHRNRPPTLAVAVEVDTDRVLEGEELRVRAVLHLDDVVAQADVELVVPPTFDVVTGDRRVLAFRTSHVEQEWAVVPRRWGRWAPATVRVRLHAAGRLHEVSLSCAADEVTVFPRPAVLSRLLAPALLPNRLGDHASRAVGEGVEFAGIRPYVWGDRQRRINWAASTRRGRLQTNQYAAERAVDLVLLLDGYSDAGPLGDSSLDRAVRGVVGTAQSYLRQHDRVGLVTMGGILRWLRPDVGERQAYRVVDAVLSARSGESLVDPDLAGRLPATVLPSGALVVVFSALLDARALDAVRDLRGRGHPVVVVDVLGVEPQPDPTVPTALLALRLWRLDHAALHHELGGLGVPVVDWASSEESLDAALAPVARLPLRVGR